LLIRKASDPRQFLHLKNHRPTQPRNRIIFHDEDQNKSILTAHAEQCRRRAFENWAAAMDIFGAEPGYFEYVVPDRNDLRKVGTIRPRAYSTGAAHRC
jgi:hypothetical protein